MILEYLYSHKDDYVVTRKIMEDIHVLKEENIDIIRAHLYDIIMDGYVEKQSPNKPNVVKITPTGIRFHFDEDSYTKRASTKINQEAMARVDEEKKKKKEKLETFNLWVDTLKNGLYLLIFAVSVVLNIILVLIPWVKRLLNK